MNVKRPKVGDPSHSRPGPPALVAVVGADQEAPGQLDQELGLESGGPVGDQFIVGVDEIVRVLAELVGGARLGVSG